MNKRFSAVIKTLDKLLSIFFLITLGFAYGRGGMFINSQDIPFLVVVSLIILFVSTVIDFLIRADQKIEKTTS